MFATASSLGERHKISQNRCSLHFAQQLSLIIKMLLTSKEHMAEDWFDALSRIVVQNSWPTEAEVKELCGIFRKAKQCCNCVPLSLCQLKSGVMKHGCASRLSNTEILKHFKSDHFH